MSDRIDIPNSLYLARGLCICAMGWLSGALADGGALQPPLHAILPVLAMLIFMGLDRHMLSNRSRPAERLATDIGQFSIALTLSSLAFALLVEGMASWQCSATWLSLSAAVLSMLNVLEQRIAWWRPSPLNLLVVGDCQVSAAFTRQLDSPATHLPWQRAISWLNEARSNTIVDEVVIFDPDLADGKVEELLEAIRQRHISLHCSPQNSPQRVTATAWTTLSKRLFDMLCATLLLCCLAPFMLSIAMLVRLQDGGPALFRQQRLGLNGKCITVLKFRSMQVAAGHDPLAPQAHHCDPRITRLGHWMRHWGIDELPQLLNVLRGDMSMVGPRPHAVAHDLRHDAYVPDYALRRAAKPGITGLAQVRGMRGETRISNEMVQRIDADLEYIARQSLWLDVLILLATPLALLRHEHKHETWLAPRKSAKDIDVV